MEMHLVPKSCTIRPWRLDDAESLAKHANNRKVWLGLRDLFPDPYTIDDAHEFLQKKIVEQSATIFCIEMTVPPLAGSAFTQARTCIGSQRQWVTGWAKSSGDAAS
jgi:hypothetical protein